MRKRPELELCSWSQNVKRAPWSELRLKNKRLRRELSEVEYGTTTRKNERKPKQNWKEEGGRKKIKKFRKANTKSPTPVTLGLEESVSMRFAHGWGKMTLHDSLQAADNKRLIGIFFDSEIAPEFCRPNGGCLKRPINVSDFLSLMVGFSPNLPL